MKRTANVCQEGEFSMGGHLRLGDQGSRFAFVLTDAEIGASVTHYKCDKWPGKQKHRPKYTPQSRSVSRVNTQRHSYK